MTRRSSNGDGDDCPVVPSHGAMYVLQGNPGAQYCPDQSHDGVWTEGGHTPATRRLWPVGYRSFAEAVAQYEAGPVLTGVVDTPEGARPAPLPTRSSRGVRSRPVVEASASVAAPLLRPLPTLDIGELLDA